MTLAELRYLVALDQEQHFGRAAVICGISQPALSNGIRKLEIELGVTLFERTRSSVCATPIGEQIIAQARQVLHSTTAIEDIARAGCDHLSSPLAVGAIFTIAPYLLPQCVLHLRKTASKLSLRTEEAYAQALREKLRAGELDAIVVSAPFAEADIVCQALFEEPFVVLMEQQHPLAARNRVNEADLRRQTLLLPGNQHCLRQQIVDALPQLNLAAEAANCETHGAGTGTLETLRSLVVNGLGIVVLPLSAATALCSGHRSLTLRPFNDPAPGRTVSLAWRISFPRHKAVDVLRNAILACKPAADFYITDAEPAGHGLLVDNGYW